MQEKIGYPETYGVHAPEPVIKPVGQVYEGSVIAGMIIPKILIVNYSILLAQIFVK